VKESLKPATAFANARPEVAAAASRFIARFGWRIVHYAIILRLHAHFIESGRKAAGRDWSEYFYPLVDAVRLSIVKYHQFPWWDPWLLGGQPLFAEPQIAVFMPDTLITALFGTVVGLKIVLVFYFFVGYEGTRFLCRELFGPNPFTDAVALIPALVTPLALHFNEGHLVFVVFYFFPWVLALALSWERSAGRSLAFGLVMGCYLLSYIHYTIIMSASIVAPIVIVRLWKHRNQEGIWARTLLAGCVAMALGFARLCLTLALVSRFPRTEQWHYPTAFSFDGIVGTLIQPFQDRTATTSVAGLYWWELGCYVGVCGLFLAYEGLRMRERKFWPLYAGALLCLVLAWNNRDRWLPGYWLHFIPPWNYMLIITRWRLFGCYFLLLGAVHGLVGIRRRGRPRLAASLAAFVIFDLGYHVTYGYRDMFAYDEPPFVAAPDPPKTVRDQISQTWRDLRENLVSGGAESTLLGYGYHYPNRQYFGERGYVGEFYGSSPVAVERWTPNRIVLRGTPGDTVTLNINPSNYWLMNGQRLFPAYRPVEIEKPFNVKVPPGGRMEFLASPPHWPLYFSLQGAFALAALIIFLSVSRSKGSGAGASGVMAEGSAMSLAGGAKGS
jgi:hypothetical protein